MTRLRLIATCVPAMILAGWLILQIQKDKWLHLRIPGLGDRITSIAFSPDGSTVAFAAYRGPSIHVWDAKTKREKFVLNGQRFTEHLQYTDSGDLVRTAADHSGGIRLWNRNGEPIGSYREDESATLRIPGLSKSCGYEESKSETWSEGVKIIEYSLVDRISGEIVDSIRYSGLVQSCFIAASDRCVFGHVMIPEKNPENRNRSGMTIIVNLLGGSLSVLPVIECTSGNTAISLLSDDLVAIYEGGMNLGRGVRIWNLKSRENVATLPHFSREFPPIIKRSPDGKRIAVAGGDSSHHYFIPLPDMFNGPYGEVKLWNIAESRTDRNYKTDRIVTAIEFSPDGRRIAVGFQDGTLEILNESFTMSDR